MPVTVLPGASAVETALVASGFAAERYQFLGYLPRGRGGARRRCGTSSRRWPWPAVAFESPRRLPATLRSLAAALARAAGRRLPRADQAVRGGRPRAGRGGRRPVLGAAERRDHASSSGRRRWSPDEERGRGRRRRARRRRRPAPAGGRSRLPADRRAPERALPALSVTRHARKCNNSVTSIDNGGEPRPTMVACCLSLRTVAAAALLFLVLAPAARRLDLARVGPGPRRVPPRERPVRRRAAPRNRHRRRSRLSGRRAAGRDGHVRRRRRDERPERRRSRPPTGTPSRSSTSARSPSAATPRSPRAPAVGDDRPDRGRRAAEPVCLPRRARSAPTRTATSIRWASSLRGRAATPPAPQPAPAPAVAPPPASRPPRSRHRAAGRQPRPSPKPRRLRRSTASPVEPEPVATEAPAEAPASEPAAEPAGTDPEPVAADPSGVTLAAPPAAA